MSFLWGQCNVLSYHIEPDTAGIESRPCYRGILKLRDLQTTEEWYDLGPAWDTERQARSFAQQMFSRYGV